MEGGKIKDRIIDFRRVKASEISPNPNNWRRHPNDQREHMQSVLTEIGYTDALVVTQREDGQYMLIDGHLRRDVSGDAIVPVVVTNLSESEAAIVLATHDPIGAMAQPDSQTLEQLLNSIADPAGNLTALLKEVGDSNGLNVEPYETGEQKETGATVTKKTMFLALYTEDMNQLDELLTAKQIDAERPIDTILRALQAV